MGSARRPGSMSATAAWTEDGRAATPAGLARPRVIPVVAGRHQGQTDPVPRMRVSGRSLVTCGIVASLLALLAGQQWPILQLRTVSDDAALAFLDITVGLSLVLTGAYLLNTRQRSNGAILAAAGSLWLLASVRWALAPSAFIHWVIVPIPIGLLALVLLRYPDQRLPRRSVRIFITFLIAWLVLGRLVNALLWDPAWAGSFGTWWPTVVRNAEAYTVTARLYHGGGVVLAVGYLLLVLDRVRRSTGLMRLRTWPVAVLGPAGAVAFGLQSLNWLVPLRGDTRQHLSIASDVALLTIPAAFAVIALQHKLEQGHVADVVTRMQHADSPEQIRDALRHAVSEPRLELAFQLPDSTLWVNSAGKPLALEELDRDHLLVPLNDSDGRPLAVVVTAPGLTEHRDVLDPAIIAVRMSLENLRLQAVALARLEEVTQSRRRLMLAGVEERRRVERDLHDGAQQRLLAVSASLARARERTTDAASLAVLDIARDDLRAALRDLRELAAGLHPAVLSQSGLAIALSGVTERLPLAVRTQVEERRWPADLEMAAYCVICECLTNIVKHSGAASAMVSAHQKDGCLLLSVQDDGTGGAVSAPGRGLAGLSDRVAALGGTFSIESAPGRGTHVQVALPCG